MNNKENILIIRTAPVETVKKILTQIRNENPGTLIHLLVQDDVVDQFIDEDIKFHVFEKGPFSLNSISDVLWCELHQLKIKTFIIPSNHDEFKGYDLIVDFGLSLEVKECVLITSNLKKKIIRPCGLIIQLIYLMSIYILASGYYTIKKMLFFFRNMYEKKSTKHSSISGLKKKKKIACFSYHYIPTSSVLIPFCKYMVDHGYEIEWYHVGTLRNNDHSAIGDDLEINIIQEDVIDNVNWIKRLKSDFFRQITSNSLKNWLLRRPSIVDFDIFPTFINHLVLKSALKGKKYALMIGFEERGLGFAEKIKRLNKINSPLIYWNLELNMRGVVSHTEYSLRKGIEFINRKRINKIIIQDRFRRAVMENKLEGDYIEIPVALNLRKELRKTVYIRNLYNIAENRKIILYSGSILRFHYLKELVSSALTWDENWILIIHGIGNNQFLEEIKLLALNKSNIIFSSNYLEEEKLYEMICSADIGISLFNPIDPNLKFTAKSSGKIAQYLRCGLPVIINDNEASRFLIEGNPCAFLIKDKNEIKLGIKTILNNYELYKENAYRTYENYYRIEPYMEKLIESIQC